MSLIVNEKNRTDPDTTQHSKPKTLLRHCLRDRKLKVSDSIVFSRTQAWCLKAWRRLIALFNG